MLLREQLLLSFAVVPRWHFHYHAIPGIKTILVFPWAQNEVCFPEDRMWGNGVLSAGDVQALWAFHRPPEEGWWCFVLCFNLV